MIVNLTAKYIGQYVEFTYETPLRGLLSISTFVDTTTGTTGTRLFKKEFSYTLDGVKYGDWISLTNGNLAAIGTLPIKNDFIIKFRYTRIGTDNTGLLVVNTLIVNGTFSLSYLQVLDFSNGVFSDIGFTDQYWNQVWLNLLNKLYDYGVVPKYIERGEDNPNDEDYITFWKSVAYYFALTIALVDEKISKIMIRQDELAEYLLQKGIFVCGDETITTLNVIANNIYDQVRRRATLGITYQDGTFSSPMTNPVHGELLRIICFDIVTDEFLFEYIKNSGWYVDIDSPTYFGLTKHLQLNKSSEQSTNITSLSNYIVTGTVALVTDGSHQVARLNAGATLSTPIVKIDDTLDYEFTFMIKLLTASASDLQVSLSVTDHLGYLKNTQSIQNGSVQLDFLPLYSAPTNAVYYFFRGILFNKGKSLMTSIDDYQTSVNAGRNLRMISGSERVQLSINNVSGSHQLSVYDIKIKPLKAERSNIYINGGDMTRMWVKNRNFNLENNISPYHKLTIDDALNIKIRENLIPMESGLIMYSIGSNQVNTLNNL